MIDPQTAEHIELMTCLGDKKSKLSLFGVMNHCVTKGESFRLRHIFDLFSPGIGIQPAGSDASISVSLA